MVGIVAMIKGPEPTPQPTPLPTPQPTPPPSPTPSSCIDPHKQKVQTPSGVRLLQDVLDELGTSSSGLPKVKVVPFPRTFKDKIIYGMQNFLDMDVDGEVVNASVLLESYRLKDGQGGYDSELDADGRDITLASGEHLYLSAEHALLAKAGGAGRFQKTYVNDIAAGDLIKAHGGHAAVTGNTIYAIKEKVGLMTAPFGMLLSESGVLIPPMNEGRPDTTSYVNVDDMVILAEDWLPAAEKLHTDHPCLFDFIDEPGEDDGKAVVSEFLENFYLKHPHQSDHHDVGSPGHFIEYLEHHDKEFAEDAKELCAGDVGLDQT